MNDETFILYTTKEGGFFKVAHATRDEYLKAVECGLWDERSFEDRRLVSTEPSALSMVAFVRVEDNHDFVLGGSRDEPDTWDEKFRAA